METIQSLVEKSPYAAALGVECQAIAEGEISLRLPYAEHNANPGKALHGVVISGDTSFVGIGWVPQLTVEVLYHLLGAIRVEWLSCFFV